MKQHASLSRTEDSGFDMTDTDQEVELSNGNFNLETTVSLNSAIGDVDINTLVHSSPTNKIDKNNLFFCHECSTEVSNFEAFEKHVENHFMEIENKSTASTSPTQKNLAGIYSGNWQGAVHSFCNKIRGRKGLTLVIPQDIRVGSKIIQGFPGWDPLRLKTCTFFLFT